jgi:hypothetical protein
MRRDARAVRVLVLALASGLAHVGTACSGELSLGPSSPGGGDLGTCRSIDCDEPSPASRVPRLSHPQWENATRDLLRLDASSGLSHTFLNDARRGNFDNAGGDLVVGEPLWTGYQSAAEILAAQVASDPTALARLLPADLPASPPDARARAFVGEFGQRAFRRPLESAEIDTYAALFAQGATFYPEHDAFTAGVQVTIEAMLQSPHFLYRPELDTTIEGGRIVLDDFELASRLSFALWNTIPDDTLLAAAQAHQLSTDDGLRTQATRMLADPRAHAMVALFHAELLDTASYGDVTPRDATLFPEWDDALHDSMQAETAAFVDDVVFHERAGLTRMLTAPFTYVDAPLARVYGLSGSFGTTLTRVDLDPTRRAGLLTQIGFLAHNASPIESDAIHRGVFVNRRILCAPLPPPPMNVPPLPPDDPTMPLTIRERITRHTGPGTCGATCHGTLINPIGFAYEHYDALGRWRDTDAHMPVDASATYTFGRQTLSYDGAIDLASVIATQPFSHECYVQNWVEYLHGRQVAANDGPTIVRIGRRSLAESTPVQDLILAVVTSRAFRTRSTIEYDRLMETSP